MGNISDRVPGVLRHGRAKHHIPKETSLAEVARALSDEEILMIRQSGVATLAAIRKQYGPYDPVARDMLVGARALRPESV
jgi:hypothetical protein